jgi:hypothetical protein
MFGVVIEYQFCRYLALGELISLGTQLNARGSAQGYRYALAQMLLHSWNPLS